MQYRNFGKIDFKPSALGFGAMRLPTIDNDSKNIDEKKAIEMIRYGIDNGVNYIDTAWPYHGGNSELLVSKALKDGYRQRVKIATKLPSWLIKEPEDMDKYLNKQMEKLNVRQIDFYLIHALNRDHWTNLKELGLFSWIPEAKESERINYIGFSFHDNLDLFKEIVDSYPWDFCQIQYNYLNREYQAGSEGLKYAASRGLGVVIMEPLLGGRLAEKQPDVIQEFFDKASVKRTPADWALQWLWNQPEVSLVLSGMSTLQQVKENIASAANSGVNKLSDQELETIDKVTRTYQEINPINCTGCEYCMPCPNGVNIPGNISNYNTANVFNRYKKSKEWYDKMDANNRATACVSCGMCESKCPQQLEISSIMENIASYFEND
jgi:hypothetical protein